MSSTITDARLSTSIDNFKTWPHNLLYNDGRAQHLPSYKKNGEIHACPSNNCECELHICEHIPPGVCDLALDAPHIHFRDHNDVRNVCDARELIESEESLTAWLGHRRLDDSSHQSTIKADPLCRFVILVTRGTRLGLAISPRMLARLLTHHQVPAHFLTILRVFEERMVDHQHQSNDKMFSSFFAQTHLSQALCRPGFSELERSGQYFDIMYNLKSCETVHKQKPADIDVVSSPCHTGVFHRFDVVTGRITWIMAKPGNDLVGMIKKLTRKSRPETHDFSSQAKSFRSSLLVHIALAQHAQKEWWPHMYRIEHQLEQKVSTDTIDEKLRTGHSAQTGLFNQNELRDVISYEDRARTAGLIFQTNLDVLEQISTFYKNLLYNQKFVLRENEEVQAAVTELTELLYPVIADFRQLRLRAEFLQGLAKDRKEIILQFMQAKVTGDMSVMTQQSIKEAVIMRIITIVTLVFLPATFVSTLFGTDIIKFQPQNDTPMRVSFAPRALLAWIAFAILLTLITVTGALFYYARVDSGGLHWIRVRLAPWRRRLDALSCAERGIRKPDAKAVPADHLGLNGIPLTTLLHSRTTSSWP